MCQSHTGRLTGLWFLPKPAFGLNTNDDDPCPQPCNSDRHICAGQATVRLAVFGSYLLFEQEWLHAYTAVLTAQLMSVIAAFCVTVRHSCRIIAISTHQLTCFTSRKYTLLALKLKKILKYKTTCFQHTPLIIFKRGRIITKKTCLPRDSSVGIATRYGLDGPGIEFRRRRDFPHPSRPALVPNQPPIQWVPGLPRG